MLDGRFRATVDKGVEPIGQGIKKTGLTADHFTILGLVLSAASCVAIGTGHLRLGLLLVVLTGLCDTFDGAVAKAVGHVVGPRAPSSTRSPTGSATRCCSSASPGTSASPIPGPLALLPMAVLATSSVISYQRAKAESLGLAAKGGIMERAERIILLRSGSCSRRCWSRCWSSCSPSRSSPPRSGS